MLARRTAVVAVALSSLLFAGAIRQLSGSRPMPPRPTTPGVEPLGRRLLLDANPTPAALASAPAQVAAPAPAPAAVQVPGGYGINLSSNDDWGTDEAWVDVRNLFRQWGLPDQPWNPNPGLRLTADGYPLADAGALTYLKDYPDGTYLLSYKGTAAVTFGGMGRLAGPLVTQGGVTTGAVTINHAKGDLLTMVVRNVDPANPIDDLHLIRPGYALGATQVFTDDFLRRLRPFRTIRFLGWTDANGTPGTDWAGRVTPADFLQTGPQGVAYENIVALANAVGKDVWITLPDQVSDDYVRQLADLLRDGLKPGLNVTLEYSNELWNGSFPQFKRVLADAKANPLLTKTDDFGRVGQQAAFKLMEVSAIFRREFGAQAARVRPVLCGQDANAYFLQCGLAFLQQQYGAPAQYLAGIGIAPYIDLDPAVDHPGMTMDALFASMNQFLNTKLAGWVAAHAALAKQYGLPMLAYEGGQSLVAWNATLKANVNMDLKAAAQADPRMGDLYRSLDALWKQNGGGQFEYFTLYSSYGKSGYWGLLPGDAPGGNAKWDAVLGIVLEDGDATLDGAVDFADFAVIKANFGKPNACWEQGDFNRDGVVDAADLAIFQADAVPLTPDQQAQVDALARQHSTITPST